MAPKAVFKKGPRKLSDAGDSKSMIYEFLDGDFIYDSEKSPSAPGAAAANAKLSALLFGVLENNGIQTHFTAEEGVTSIRVSKLRYFPLTVICRNLSAGTLPARLGLAEGETLPVVLVEYNLDTEAAVSGPFRHNVLTEITEGDAREIFNMMISTNNILKKFLETKGLVLADFYLEFGRNENGRLFAAGEISADTCRLWDKAEFEKLDKDRFRRPVKAEDAVKRISAA
ncbi:MAG TPA: phosphoribosylaminoimidazolesuccinocarboxamide synthase [bacterium]|nr:phosphoribosylaminoimidazolesuccinocarboxamide synthase [bacterium]